MRTVMRRPRGAAQMQPIYVMEYMGCRAGLARFYPPLRDVKAAVRKKWPAARRGAAGHHQNQKSRCSKHRHHP